MLDYNDAPIKFNIYTRAWDAEKQEFLPDSLVASLGPDKKMRLSGTASSTIKDLHGDEIVETALIDMETAANGNLTIFGNHKYEVPEDVFGSVEAAVLARSVAQTKTGDPVHDLRMSIVINEENERAVKTWRAISKGTKLGLSIGAMIPEGGAKIDKKSKRLIIEHLDLLETSIVGIPANPRSWVDSARKSYFEAPQPITAELTETVSPYISYSQTVGDVTQTVTTNGTTTAGITWPTLTPIDEFVTQGIDGMTLDDPTDEIVTPTTESDVATDATSVPETVEPTEETQAAPQSEPPSDEVTNSASETVAAVQEVVVGLDADVTAAFEQMADLVEKLTTELRSARDAKASAEWQRDEAIKEATQAIAKVNVIVKKLSGLPLGPRAAVVRDAAKDDLSALEGIYSREWLELLRS